MKAALFGLLCAVRRLERRLIKQRLRTWISVSASRAFWASRRKNIGVETRIGKHVVVQHPGQLETGDTCSIAAFVHLQDRVGAKIAKAALMARHIAIASMTRGISANLFAESIIRKPVVIDDNGWIGAGAVVIKDVPARSVVCGGSAKRLRGLDDRVA